MKLYITALLTLFGLILYSQRLTEVHRQNDTLKFELEKVEGITIENLKFINFGYYDTTRIKQWVIDSLNGGAEIIVIDKKAFESEFNLEERTVRLMVIANDSLHYGYPFLPNSDLSGSYSRVYLDSLELNKNGSLFCDEKVYVGIGKPSLGKKNKLEDCLATVKGKLYVEGRLQVNTRFVVYEGWNPETRSDTITTDSEGNYVFETFPGPEKVNGHKLGNSCNNEFQDYGYFFVVVEGFPTYLNFANISSDVILPGENYIDILDVVVKIKDLKVSTALTCSPNPASSYVKVKYSIAETASWKDCSIIISNNQGQAVLQTPIETPQGDVEIKLPSTLAKGMYYCSVAYKGQAVKTVQLLVK